MTFVSIFFILRFVKMEAPIKAKTFRVLVDGHSKQVLNVEASSIDELKNRSLSL